MNSFSVYFWLYSDINILAAQPDDVLSLLILSVISCTQQRQQTRTTLRLPLRQPQQNVRPVACRLALGVLPVDEIAPVAVHAAEVQSVVVAFFRFVLHIHFMVSQQFVRAMREFAPLLVGAEPILHKSAAKFGFLLLGLLWVERRPCLGRWGGGRGRQFFLLGWAGVRSGRVALLVKGEHGGDLPN